MKNLYENLPDTPGVYIFKNSAGKILYIGKAGNLKRRVSSYFLRPHDSRIHKLVSEIRKIDYKKTDSALEALILEASLIKKNEPPFNIKDKDDRSFLYVEITRDEFPRVLLVRGKDLAGKGLVLSGSEAFGPFTSASNIREALRIIRRIFPFNVHSPEKIGAFKKPCFDYEIGLCPGTCVGAVSKSDYQNIVKNLELFFSGEKKKILKNLEKEMRIASCRLEFEKAAKIRKQIFALQHIQDVALINELETLSGVEKGQVLNRIEGYDISNISGTSAVGAMVVFRGEKSSQNEYRKFKIGSYNEPNDVGMLKEILRRRFAHAPAAAGWPLPDLILIDGGKGQVNAAKNVLLDFGLVIPVVGIAKGPERKKNEFIGKIPKGVSEKTLIQVRDEAHRFAISYYRKLGRAAMIN
ncbi:MAG: GIY-YIG nuclease family protein [Patescibacteria group bacterium]